MATEVLLNQDIQLLDFQDQGVRLVNPGTLDVLEKGVNLENKDHMECQEDQDHLDHQEI